MRRRRKLFKDKAIASEILEEQGNCCAYCAVELNALNPAYFDHFIPWAAGGRNDKGNIFACCRGCNQAKSDKVFVLFEECRQYLYDYRKARQSRVIDLSAE